MDFFKALIFSLAAGGFLNSEAATANNPVAENEARQVAFSERVIISELAKGMSSVVRDEKSNCGPSCVDNGALDVAVGLLGVSKSEVADVALVNMFGVRLDGAGSEEFGCQILIRGKEIVPYFFRLTARQSVNHCREAFFDLKRRELTALPDVGVEQVCRTEKEIIAIRDDYLKALKSGVECEQ